MKTSKISLLAFAVALTACGGGSSSSDEPSPSSSSAPSSSSSLSSSSSSSSDGALTETGVFTDSAVAGINYQTTPGNQSGKTNALGEYQYVEGDSVTFSLSDQTTLPPVTATKRVTPADMADGNNADVVINVLRLLQTLDEDGNPDNGITISQQTLDDLIGKNVEVNQDASAFETEAEASIGKTLVTQEEAAAHFAASQQADLRGSWLIEDDFGKNILSFVDGGRYIISHSDASDTDQEAATAEWGTYAWDPTSGDLTLTMSAESDNSGGLSDLSGEAVTLELVDDQLVLSVGELSDDQYDADDTITFTAVKNASNPLVGAWYLAEEEGFNVLTILDDSHYTIAHSNNQESYDGEELVEVSSEWGTYQLNDESFDPVATAETDGEGGLYNKGLTNEISGPYYSLSLKPWGDLDFIEHHPDGDNEFSFSRIGRFGVNLEDLNENASTAIVEREEDGFFGGQGIDFSIDLVGENDKVNIYLNADGTGTLIFSPGTEEEESSTIDAPWKATTSGTLVFTETMADESTGSWTLAPIKSRDSDAVIVDFRHIDGGTESLLGFFISDVGGPVEEGGEEITEIDMNGFWEVEESYDVCGPLTVHYNDTSLSFDGSTLAYSHDFVSDITWTGEFECQESPNGEPTDSGSVAFSGNGVMDAAGIESLLDDSEVQGVEIVDANQFVVTLEFESGNGTVIVTQTWTRQPV